MKNFRILLSVAAFFVLSFNIVAHAEDKVALVSLQKALNGVEEGKKAMATIKADFDAKQKQLETMKAELKKTRDDLEKQKSVLSQEALKAKADEMQGKFMELQQKAMQYEKELKDKENASVSKILASLKSIVGTVAKSKGYTMVYENSADVVLYSANAVDITADVIAAYNSGAGKK